MTCTIVPLAIGFWSSLLVYLPVSCKGSSQEVINIHLRMDQNSGRRLGCEAKAGEEVGVHLYYRKDPSQEWIEYTYKYSSWPSNDSRNENCKDEDPDFCIYRTTDGGKGYVGKGYIRLWKFNPEKHSGYYNCVTLVANRDNVRSRSFVWKVSLAGKTELCNCNYMCIISFCHDPLCNYRSGETKNENSRCRENIHLHTQ